MAIYQVEESYLVGGGDRSHTEIIYFKSEDEALKFIDYMTSIQDDIFVMDQHEYKYKGELELPRAFSTAAAAINGQAGATKQVFNYLDRHNIQYVKPTK